MISLAEPDLSGNERKYLNDCIDTTFVSSVGAYVTRFEKDIAKVSGSNHATAVSSGTAGLHLALKTVGVESEELVCIPSFTFIATANAVSHCGARPWLIDINDESWTMDADILQNELENKTEIIDGKVIHKKLNKRVAAIVPVYTLGIPADMEKINNIAKKYNIPVVADAAAAIGANYKDGNIGNLATATVFSFNGNKTVTCGGGGAIVSDNKSIIDKAKHLATTARCGIDYDHDMVGYNYRMTNIQAAVGCAQLERVDAFVAKKRYIDRFYRAEFKGCSDISFFPSPDYAHSSCWFSGIKLSNKYDIKQLCEILKEKGIEARTFWKPVHNQKPYINSERSLMNVTDGTWKHILTLPSSVGVTDEQLKYVVMTVKSIL